MKHKLLNQGDSLCKSLKTMMYAMNLPTIKYLRSDNKKFNRAWYFPSDTNLCKKD